jgi:transcriptional regulator CtsR
MGKVIEFPKSAGEEMEEPSCRMSEWLYTLYSHLLDQQEQLAEIERRDMIEDMDHVFSRIPSEILSHMNERYGQERGIDWPPEH